VPAGAVRSLTDPLPQTPGLILLLSENNVNFQQIFTDGRPLPEDPNPSWNGYSIGRWEGDTLIVETNGPRDGIWLDRKGSPLTQAPRVTERFRRLNYGNMEIEVTVNDPKAYTAPWTIKLQQFAVISMDLLDDSCLEAENSVRHMQTK
jgi:hypothetical protein